MQIKNVHKYIAGTIGVGAVAFAAAMYLPSFASSATAAAPSSPAGAAVKKAKVAAVVNGHEIFDSELEGAISQGVDRAVAVDRYINKVLVADLARSNYESDAKEALKGAEREVLSQLYVSKKSAQVRAAVTDAMVKSYYDTNIKVEDFTSYKVKFLVVGDEKEASDAAASIAAGKSKEMDAKFKPFKEGDGFLTGNELPYNLGNVVRGLKKGEYSRPVALRNGIFILNLEDVKANPKPEFAKVSEDIKSFLIGKTMNEELAAVRASAKIELR